MVSRLENDELTEEDVDYFLAEEEEHTYHDEVKKSNLQRRKDLLTKKGLRSRVATTEHHYYHMDEVWHAIVNPCMTEILPTY